MVMFTLDYKHDFCLAKQLKPGSGPCSRLHGSHFRLHCQITSKQLSDQGMVIDYQELKMRIDPIIAELDHQHLNTIKPFDKLNPTTENLAEWLFIRLEQCIDDLNINLKSIRLVENDAFGITYCRDSRQ